MHPFYSLTDYQQWHWIWTPFSPTQSGLFLVRYPGDLIQMTRPLYESLVKLRFQQLIQRWMEENSATAEATHQMLSHALFRLESLQEVPRLGDRWEWQESWADTLIEFNETFFQKLSLKMERNFPFRIHPPLPSEQERLQSLYQDMTLNDWLEELI